MKRIYIFILALFALNNADAQWTKVTTLTKQAGYDIAITVLGINNGSIYITDSWNRTTTRSDDGGKTWTKVNQNMLTAMVFVGSTIYAADFYGVYLSTDKGATWKTISNSSVKGVYCLAAVGTTIYAGVDKSGIYMTTDNGTTWTLLGNGFNGTSTQHTVQYISSGNGKLYASTNYGVYVSSDNGSNWSALTGAAWPSSSGRSDPAGITAVNGSTICAKSSSYPTTGVFVSTNGGTSWTKANTTEIPYGIIFKGNTIIIGTGNGVFSSTDNGATWTDERSADFVVTKKNITSLVSNGTNLYAGTGSDLWMRPLSEFASGGTGITDEKSVPEFQIYPNPTQDILYIDGIKNKAELSVYDMTGRKVISTSLNPVNNHITVSSLTKGIYFVQLTDSANTIIVKLAKE